MKLFQRLLVAPAALGLMAPMAANADVSGISDSSTDEVIQAQIDGVEAQLGEIQAGAFSSSTTMSGKAAFITGFVDDDTCDCGEDEDEEGTDGDTDSITMEYMYQLNMNTSFTGRDLLYTRIKTGNVSDHFKDKGQGTYLSAANGNNDILEVDKIWYQFPVGDSLQVWVGPKIENYYMLASAPSIYKPITKQFSLGGNGTVYGSSTSAGFGVAWTQQKEDPTSGRWALSAAYTSKDGNASETDLGLFGDSSKSALLTKLEYGTPRWQISGALAFKDNGWEDSYFTTSDGKDRDAGSSETAFGLRAYWKPAETGAIPSVQFGYDGSTVDDNLDGMVDEASGWMLGLGWRDLLIDGNSAGVAYGSRVSASSKVGSGHPKDGSKDNNVWEAYYTFKINDGITVTPAIFAGSDVKVEEDNVTGAVLLTEFRF